LAYTKAQKHGHYDALLLDDEDTILEGTRTNFFAIKDSLVITPPGETVLDGVTRQTVLAVAKRNNFIVREEKISLQNLSEFDGAFLTSTSSKILPLIQIDDFTFSAIPQKLKELMKFYDVFLENYSPLSSHLDV
jgi:branched-chain amino acid aminotransferase